MKSPAKAKPYKNPPLGPIILSIPAVPSANMGRPSIPKKKYARSAILTSWTFKNAATTKTARLWAVNGMPDSLIGSVTLMYDDTHITRTHNIIFSQFIVLY